MLKRNLYYFSYPPCYSDEITQWSRSSGRVGGGEGGPGLNLSGAKVLGKLTQIG